MKIKMGRYAVIAITILFIVLYKEKNIIAAIGPYEASKEPLKYEERVERYEERTIESEKLAEEAKKINWERQRAEEFEQKKRWEKVQEKIDRETQSYLQDLEQKEAELIRQKEPIKEDAVSPLKDDTMPPLPNSPKERPKKGQQVTRLEGTYKGENRPISNENLVALAQEIASQFVLGLLDLFDLSQLKPGSHPESKKLSSQEIQDLERSFQEKQISKKKRWIEKEEGIEKRTCFDYMRALMILETLLFEKMINFYQNPKKMNQDDLKFLNDLSLFLKDIGTGIEKKDWAVYDRLLLKVHELPM